MTLSRLGIVWAAALLAGAACTDLDSATNLNPEGPPMIRQVRMKEVRVDATGSTSIRPVFAFGTHDLASTNDYPVLGPNSMITAAAVGQEIRIVIDELLIGNNLEEIACRAPVDDDAYDRVPLGTTPDDVARCSVAKDVLPSSCPGTMEHAVCICKIDGGCGETPKGGPVGVLDVNQDGAADDTRFINGAVGIQCGSLNVPIDLNNSYWNPSGDQNKPAMGGFDVLGPAIKLVPAQLVGGTPVNVLPTNQRCQLTFSPDVVDKQNHRVCAPALGDVTAGCTEGDVSAFSFMTQALTIRNQNFGDGDTGIDRQAPITLVASAPVAMGSLGAVTLTLGGNPVAGAMITLPQPQIIRINLTTPLAANTTYVLSVANTLTDTYGQQLVMPAMYTFTTGS